MKFIALPGFPAKPSKKARRNPLSPDADLFLDALERIAGKGQLAYMGPFVFIGDGTGDVLGQIEPHFPKDGDKTTVHLGFIGVSPKNRGKGNATKIMNMLVQAADEVGLDMDLNISPSRERGDKSPQLTARQLAAFYKKFGFKTQGHWKDMIRSRKTT
jgi:GNAT superfamily N-acetyltransferase